MKKSLIVFTLVVLIIIAVKLSLGQCLALSEIAHQKKTLLYFSANWCTYCQSVDKLVLPSQDVQNALKSYNFKKVNYDTEKALVNKHNVKSVPTFVVVDAFGRSISRRVGYQSANSLSSWLRGK